MRIQTAKSSGSTGRGICWFVFLWLGAVAGLQGQSVSEFPLPQNDRTPMGITTGPDSALWFTEYTANRIGRITNAGVVTEFTLPTPNSGPSSIAAGPDGNLWFTERTTGFIGRITTSGTIT